MYIVLSGAKKNIGDYLITERCKRLLKKHRPEHELIQLPHWKTLDNKIDTVNESSGIIIMGGPGFQKYFYPNIYKLMPDINDIKVPIIPMGLGWKGFPGDHITLKKYKFSNKSLKILKKINKNTKYISCRDYLTKKALIQNGLTNILMTGCPVWYDINSIGKEMERPEKVKKIIYTPAQRPIYRQQSIDIMALLKKIFPANDLYCSFHRGISSSDEFTPKTENENNLILKKEAEKLGFRTIDTSHDLNKLKLYDKCDLHVGYRVHGHIFFLSKRKPSILIHEDGRGKGVSDALNVKGIDAFERTIYNQIAEKISVPKLSGGINKIFSEIIPNTNILELLEDYLTEEIENGFLRFSGVGKVIDSHYTIMKKFLKSLPD